MQFGVSQWTSNVVPVPGAFASVRGGGSTVDTCACRLQADNNDVYLLPQRARCGCDDVTHFCTQRRADYTGVHVEGPLGTNSAGSGHPFPSVRSLILGDVFFTNQVLAFRYWKETKACKSDPLTETARSLLSCGGDHCPHSGTSGVCSSS